jgi:hypothetical protein
VDNKTLSEFENRVYCRYGLSSTFRLQAFEPAAASAKASSSFAALINQKPL